MTHGAPTSLGTAHPTGTGADLSTVRSTGEQTLGTTEDGTLLGTMIHGTSHGAGTVLGTTAAGTTHGTGILGTTVAGTADGMAAGTADGTIRGTTEDGGTVLTTSTIMTSSVLEAAGFTHPGFRPPDQRVEAASVLPQGQPVREARQ